jgi:hypothetical protein
MHVGGMRLFRYEEGEMQKWEYAVVDYLDQGDYMDSEVRRVNGDFVEKGLKIWDYLNWAGEKGWDVIGITGSNKYSWQRLVMKRRIETPEQEPE